jgi:hypothetical protein
MKINVETKYMTLYYASTPFSVGHQFMLTIGSGIPRWAVSRNPQNAEKWALWRPRKIAATTASVSAPKTRV